MSADVMARLQAALGDRYRVERELGRGGMATVYLARDLATTGRSPSRCSIPSSAPRSGERFLREIRIAARLQHPHILTVLDSGEADGLLWYTMPFVDGESLRERLKREGQLPLEEAVRIGRSVAEALDYAHRHGVVHRDIKPENILLFGSEPMVADFGIARALGCRGPGPPDRDGTLARHPGLHEPGAGAGRHPARRPQRHLQPGLRAVRDAGRRAAVHRSDAPGHRREAPHGAATAARGGARRARGAGAGDSHGARPEPGGPVRHRAGLRAGAGRGGGLAPRDHRTPVRRPGCPPGSPKVDGRPQRSWRWPWPSALGVDGASALPRHRAALGEPARRAPLLGARRRTVRLPRRRHGGSPEPEPEWRRRAGDGGPRPGHVGDSAAGRSAACRTPSAATRSPAGSAPGGTSWAACTPPAGTCEFRRSSTRRAPARAEPIAQASAEGRQHRALRAGGPALGPAAGARRSEPGSPPGADRRAHDELAPRAQGVSRRGAESAGRPVRLGGGGVPGGDGARQQLRPGALPAGGGGGVDRTNGPAGAVHHPRARPGRPTERARPRPAGGLRRDGARAGPTRPSGGTARSWRPIPTTSRPGFSSPTSSTTTTHRAGGRRARPGSTTTACWRWTRSSSARYDPCSTSPCARTTGPEPTR